MQPIRRRGFTFAAGSKCRTHSRLRKPRPFRRRIQRTANWPAVTSGVTALTAVGALVFTGLSLNATRDQVAITAQSQFTDRYTKAVEQLDRSGIDHLQARLGGIYGLERLAHDSPRDQPTIIEVLSAFVRTNAPNTTPDSSFTGLKPCPARPPNADIQAALTVLGRRNTANDNGIRIDLRSSCLTGASLSGAKLDHANFELADLSNANLSDAHLSDTFFFGATLRSTNFEGADLRRAFLRASDLGHAQFSKANLDSANLSSAKLQVADLSNANLVNANLNGANLSDAALNNANVSNADLSEANLTSGIFRGTKLWNANLSGSILHGAFLLEVNFSKTNLKGADLKEADLKGVDLRSTFHDDTTLVIGSKTDNLTLGKWW